MMPESEDLPAYNAQKAFPVLKGCIIHFNSVVCCTHFAVQHFLFTGKMETDVLALTRPGLFE